MEGYGKLKLRLSTTKPAYLLSPHPCKSKVTSPAPWFS